MAKQFIYFVVSAVYRVAPRYVQQVVHEKSERTLAPQPRPAAAASQVQNGRISAEGMMIESVELQPENEAEIIPRLIASYSAAREQQALASAPYIPGVAWKTVLDAGWVAYRKAIARKDVDRLAALLRNFFRNEALSGFWGGSDMFRGFCELQDEERRRRASLMEAQHDAWRRHFPTVDLGELDAPRVGNPWGYRLAGHLLYEPVFEYHYQARYFRSLLAALEKPCVLEIGGGFGGLAWQLLKCTPAVKYIGLDLPENILLQAYYLSCAFPKARLLTYTREIQVLDRKTMEAHDIILLPNFMMPRLASLSADLVVNVRSLSEMSTETIEEYIRQIDRIGRFWFFHENIFKARREGYGIPSPQFPKPVQHVLVAASESRWPKYNATSSYPCQENLFLHRDAFRLAGGKDRSSFWDRQRMTSRAVFRTIRS